MIRCNNSSVIPTQDTVKETQVLSDYLWWIKFQCTFNTSSHPRQNHPSISFKAFCPPVYQRDNGACI
jgi:hypothetical protein